MNKYLKLFISLLLPQIAGGLGAFFTLSSVQSWYLTVNKPSWNPPSWLFGPGWTTLYVLMGIACFLIWKSEHPRKKQVLTLYLLFRKINGWAALLMIPYLLWVSFATVLNATIWYLNP